VAGCERHIARLLKVTLERENNEVRTVEATGDAVSLVRELQARLLIVDDPAPLTIEVIQEELNRDPGPALVEIIDLGLRKRIRPKWHFWGLFK